MKYKEVANYITNWLKNYVESSPVKGFVIGISGGIDSAVSSTLCARTGLPTILVEMPIHQENDQVTRAKKHINFLKEKFDNVSSTSIDLTSTFDSMKESLNLNGENSELALANTRSRLRMSTLYAIATMNNSIVCGTGNKVEDFGLFFFSKGGDGQVDVSPIADLMKSEVYALGAELGLIEEILNAIPTDGLWEGSPTDEDQLGGSYDEFEWVMKEFEGQDLSTISLEELIDIIGETKYTDRQKEVIQIYYKRHIAGLHKSLPIPVCKIPNTLK